MQAEPARRRYRWQVWFLLAVVAALVFGQIMFTITENAAANTTFGGDPPLYQASMQRMFDGEIPYLDFAFEHLPLSILPMAVAHLITLITPIAYSGAFALVSAAMLFATSWLVIRLGRRLGVDAIERRWLLLLAPLLPVLLYRVDSLSVLLAVAAVALAMSGKETGALVSEIGGILAKGWPVVLAGQDWWRGKRARALALLAGSAALLALLLYTPGFREGRSFTGVHQETISGSVIVLFRLLSGAAHGLHNAAGAVYVEAGSWALGINLLIGAALALLAFSATRSAFSWPGAVLLSGTLTMALLLASPLLSAQFLLWPMPFIALGGRRPEWSALAVAAALSTVLVGYWLPANTWWHVLLAARNALLLVSAAATVMTLLERSRDYTSTSLKNLPV